MDLVKVGLLILLEVNNERIVFLSFYGTFYLRRNFGSQ